MHLILPLMSLSQRSIIKNLEPSDVTTSDFVLMGYGHIKDNMAINMVGTDNSGKLLRIIFFEKNKTTPIVIDFKSTQESPIHFVIPIDISRNNTSSYLLIYFNDHNYSIEYFQPDDLKKSDITSEFLTNSDIIPLIIANELQNTCLLYQTNGETLIFDLITKENKPFEIESSLGKIIPSHSSAFIDIDGDLEPELVLFENAENIIHINIYNKENDTYKLTDSIPLKDFKNIKGPFVFGDFDVSGGCDIAFVSHEDDGYYLNVLLNTRKRFKDHNQNSKKQYDYFSHKKHSKGLFNEKKVRIKLTSSAHSSAFVPFLMGNKTMKNIPCGIFVADINLDSYPDILIAGSISNEPYICILENRYGTGGMDKDLFVPHFYSLPNIPKSHQAKSGITVPNSKPTVISVSISDILNDNEEYLVINYEMNNQFFVEYVKNNASKDFYKISVTTKFLNTNKKGEQNVVPGISYKYYIDEDNVTRIGSQFSQSSFLHLQAPYLTFGLGPVNFLIDKFYIGGPRRQGSIQIFEPKTKLLPNSIIVFKPNNKGFVAVELYLRFSDYFLNIFLVLILVVVINLIIVFYGYKKEVKKEKQSRKLESHLFNFSAL